MRSSERNGTINKLRQSLRAGGWGGGGGGGLDQPFEVSDQVLQRVEGLDGHLSRADYAVHQSVNPIAPRLLPGCVKHLWAN